jgi:tetratricopeptide (TPR) repeat protein/tRNA A-37 threonylcarbamoyl transferase component Bud32
MNEQSNADETIETVFTEQLLTICRQFAMDLEEALNGGEPPRLESYLGQVAEPERPTLDRELRVIALKFEQRRLQLQRRGDAEDLPRALAEEGPPAEQAFAMTEVFGGDPQSDPGYTMAASEIAAGEGGPSFVLNDPGQDQVGQTTEFAPSLADPAATEFITSSSLPAGGAEGGRAPALARTMGAEALALLRATPGPKAADLGVRKTTVPGYEILSELGRGGMGVVYKARQKRLNRVVALKMVLAGAHASSQQLARFHAEAEAVAQLQHQGIVQIFEVGDHEGLPFFSLEFVEGGSLSEKIAGKPRPPREAAETMELLAQAMAVAHQHGIVHRDLKPANVLLTREGLPKITDFGLVKRVEGGSELTASGTLMGSPSYMSPEQAYGKTHEIGPPSDLYSLGAILYELLTGRAPFIGTTVLETLDQVRSREPVPPSRLQPKVPRDLETICLKCLQKETGKRYESCQALAEDLHRFSAGEPIRARPIGRGERLWRWCRRNPRVAVLSGVVVVLLGLVTASAIAIRLRLNREREAIAETRKVAGERLDQAAASIAAGDSRRAGDLLQQASLPLLKSRPELADMRSGIKRLQEQVDVYVEFKQLLDQARFHCFGSLSQKQEGQRYCQRMVQLYDQIERRTGIAASGLPPLNAEQQQTFTEDVFDAFLIAAWVEREVAQGGKEEVQQQAARKAVDLLNRANKAVPGTKAFYVHRCACWGKLGDRARDQEDKKRADAIQPTTAVDHFWHGFAHHLRGNQALRNRDRDAAEKWYRDELDELGIFLRLRPDRFWGYFNWSHAQVQLDDLQEALFGFTACIHLRPDFPWSYSNRGNILLRLKRYDQAIEDCTAALARDKSYTEACVNRGLAYFRQGKFDAALSDFNRAVELKSESASVYFHRADIYRRKNRLKEALPDADRAIALDRNSPEAYYLRAGLRTATRQYSPARDDYSAALALFPRGVEPLRDRAMLNWLYLKDFEAALADAAQLARLQPKNALPHRIMGSIHLGRRQYDKALPAFRKALDLKPDDTVVLWDLAELYFWQGDTEKALEVLDPLTSQPSPKLPVSLNLRGDVYRSMGRLDEAAKDYQRMIELGPKEPDGYIGLARVLAQQGKVEEARACYERLVAANPDSAPVDLRRAEFRRDHGAFDEAEADCDRAAGKAPDSALPPLVRASITAARGQHRQAVADAERALEKAPKDDGHVLYAAVCVWSLAAQAAAGDGDSAEDQSYADRAAALLAMALDKGFHDLSFAEHNRMIDDPAVAAIRRQPGIEDLLAHRGRR